MEIYFIPGFTGHPYEKIFRDLYSQLVDLGYSVHIIAWPNFPDKLSEYNVTNMLNHCRKVLSKSNEDKVILGISMGGIVATILATEFKVSKLGLIVSPYMAGTEDDIQGKYAEWKASGYRTVQSSKYGELKVPFAFIEDARHYNALEFISKVKCPVLFIAGEKDINVPWQVSKKLFDKANEPKEWHLIEGMEHKYQYQPEGMMDKVNKILTNFITAP